MKKVFSDVQITFMYFLYTNKGCDVTALKEGGLELLTNKASKPVTPYPPASA